jgi:hypothetical protein
MCHLLEFNVTFLADLEVSPRQRLERLGVRKGTLAYASLRPYVVETPEGFVEAADLYFEDGTVTRRIPFAWFHFVE